jgi:hypothetical protein
VQIRPDTALAPSLSSPLKPAETARNSTRVLMIWICCMQMAQFPIPPGRAFRSAVCHCQNQAAVPIILPTTKITWDH